MRSGGAVWKKGSASMSANDGRFSAVPKKKRYSKTKRKRVKKCVEKFLGSWWKIEMPVNKLHYRIWKEKAQEKEK